MTLSPAGSSRAWRRTRRFVLERDGYRCRLPPAEHAGAVCAGRATHVDHVVPRSLGGTDDPANLRAACAAGNLARGDGRPRRVELPARPAGRSWTW